MKKQLAIVCLLLSLLVVMPYGRYFNIHALKAIGWLWVLDSPYAFDDPNYVMNKSFSEMNQSGLGADEFGVT